MLAPSDKIKDTSSSFNYWLHGAAGAKATTRTLIVKDEAAYNALVNNEEAYVPALPDNWKKDAAGTTVVYKDNGK